ncbi:type II secretion system F family protein [Mycobacterium sp. NPDC003323]
MTAASLLLALALLVIPGPARHRFGRSGRTRARFRLPGWAALPVLLPAFLVWEPTVVVAAVIVVATVVTRRRAVIRARQRSTEAAQLRDALEILVSELRVGAHPVTALTTAAAEVGGQVGGRLQTVAARAGLGADIATGFRCVAALSAAPAQWHRMAVCWQLAQTHGLAIATLMRTAQHDIVERERFRARLDAALAGPRTTAAVLAGMPVLGIAMGQLIGAKPVGFLLAGGTGGAILVIGVTLSCVGLYWSDRIIAGVTT